MFDTRLMANFYIAFEAVMANRLRSLLTALGIIFGVAAVIAMMAIGNGAQQEIMEQIRLVGVNNIIIEPVVEQVEEELESSGNGPGEEKNKFSPGLRMLDVQSIKEVVPGVKKISPEVILDTHIVKSGIRRSAKLVGVTPEYFDVTNFQLREGSMFTELNEVKGDPVCIIGRGVQTKFFSKESALGKRIKCGNQWLKVIGVLEERIVSDKSIAKLGIRDFNMDVYVPVQTMLVRYKNRDMITSGNLISGGRGRRGNGGSQQNASGSQNYHQIDKLVVQVEESSLLNPTAELLSRLLQRKHYNVVDFEVTIPELLLKQQQRTQNIFNIVLGAIAGISLLVGGIGIMNIMLASVMERIKEIGLRLSLGAKKTDIVHQFLFEAMMISVSGGVIGVILGVILASMVSRFGDFPTIITLPSILVSFSVAATVGLIFGITPAKRAADQDPITSLRHE